MLAALRKKPSTRSLRHNHTDDEGKSSGEGEGDMLAPSRAEKLQPQSRDTHKRPVSSGGTSRHDTSSFLGMTTEYDARRFSRMRNQHASDSQLARKYRDHESAESSMHEGAPAPVIGITSPTFDEETPVRVSKRFNPFNIRQQSLRSRSLTGAALRHEQSMEGATGKSAFKHKGPRSSEQSPRPSSSSYRSNPPPPYGHNGEGRESLVVPSPASHASESSASDRTSVGEPYAYATTTTTHTISTTTTFFKFRKKKKKEDRKHQSLFPVPLKITPPNTSHNSISPANAPRPSLQSLNPSPSSRSSSPHKAFGRPSFQNQTPTTARSPLALESSDLVASPLAQTRPFPVARKYSENSSRSIPTTASHAPNKSQGRARSTTAASDNSRMSVARTSTPQLVEGGRSSTTSATLGRNSIAGIRSFTSRFRHSTEPNDLHTPVSSQSRMSKSQETLVVPDREEGETAGRYYARLECDIPKKTIAIILSRSADPFSHDVLRSLMRTFKFYEEPMDMALRRFLWEIDLPGEAQQIDRVMSAFAERYHECNPHIFNDFDQAYLAAYSLIILHSDLFNRNNKRKMQRSEYQKNTGGHGIDEEILGYFYDNIQYTEFIAQNPDEDDDAENKLRHTLRKPKKLAPTKPDPDRAKHGKLDPYDFIIDDKFKLDILRPSLKDVMNLEDHYSYLGTSDRIDLRDIQSAFARCSILQVVSARSRPEAFMSPSTITNPLQSHPGLIDINVVKIGTLWRKNAKRRKTRSRWQEWGTLLTASQLYFFKNSGWVKGLMHQYENFHKHNGKAGSVVFKPPLEEFRPDFSVRTLSAVALHDSSYKKHKHAFVLARHDDHLEEILLAENEDEMNEWLAKINYAATYTASNIPIQPLKSAHKNHDGQVPVDEPDSAFGGAIKASHNLEVPKLGSDELGQGSSTPARRETLEGRVMAAETNLREATQKLYENLKTARHLQILAPFPAKTRGDLLAFGARVAHRVRWSRFEVWRLRCHSDILAKELQAHDQQGIEPVIVEERLKRHPASPRPSALSRLNSKATAIIGSQRSHKHGRDSPRLTGRQKLSHAHETDIVGIDQAFATPAETLSRTASAMEGPYKLPPLDLGDSGPSSVPVESYAESLPDTPGTSDHRSSISLHSHSLRQDMQDGASQISATTHSVGNDQDTEAESDARRPSSTAESDREHQTQGNEIEGRNSRVRRSLHRTLREARDTIGRGHSRSRKGKESASSNGGEDASSATEGEGLSRGRGSFTVHGKKASVVTLGSEWQNITPEALLRTRRKAQEDKRMSLTSTAEEAEYLSTIRQQLSEEEISRRVSKNSTTGYTAAGIVRKASLGNSAHEGESSRLSELPLSSTELVRLVHKNGEGTLNGIDSEEQGEQEKSKNEDHALIDNGSTPENNHAIS